MNYDEYDGPRRIKPYRCCRDRMCGADDCPLCFPGNFIGGIYIGDIKEEEERRQEIKPNNGVTTDDL